MAHNRITVVGAGLGGLTLARVLHTAGIPAAVYDLAPSATAGERGGALELHEHSGQAALRAAGLHDAFRAIARAEGEALRVLGKDGAVRLDESDGGDTRGEVDVHALRDLLLSALPHGTVRWGARVTSVRPGEVTFGNGSALTTDLLVGADGAWSVVRPLLSAARPTYSGVSYVETHLEHPHPGIAALVGRGSMFALADGKGLLAQRYGDGRIRLYVVLRAPLEFTETVTSPEALLTHFADWSPSLRALIEEADGDLIPRPVHALPVEHRWSRKPLAEGPAAPGRTRLRLNGFAANPGLVTLVGDAAHLMSPFAGEGANLAMLDAADLASAIVQHPDDLEAALGAYEMRLFPRSVRAATESAANLAECFHADAPQPFLDRLAESLTG